MSRRIVLALVLGPAPAHGFADSTTGAAAAVSMPNEPAVAQTNDFRRGYRAGYSAGAADGRSCGSGNGRNDGGGGEYGRGYAAGYSEGYRRARSRNC